MSVFLFLRNQAEKCAEQNRIYDVHSIYSILAHTVVRQSAQTYPEVHLRIHTYDRLLLQMGLQEKSKKGHRQIQ